MIRIGKSAARLAAATRVAAALLCILSWPAEPLLAQAPAAGQEPQKVLSNEQILQALGPKTATRTLSLPSRGLARRQASETDQSVNLNIPFELNSAALKPQASEQLKQLQLALSSPSLGSNRFVVAGHTDAKGSPEYNKALSLRRAETVKRFLVDKGIDPSRLDAVGYGSDKLLSPDHPEDPSNRRVEIRAIAAAQ
jgi:outer membrane protein OmpA-like peptidoglycan-associated protein